MTTETLQKEPHRSTYKEYTTLRKDFRDKAGKNEVALFIGVT